MAASMRLAFPVRMEAAAVTTQQPIQTWWNRHSGQRAAVSKLKGYPLTRQSETRYCRVSQPEIQTDGTVSWLEGTQRQRYQLSAIDLMTEANSLWLQLAESENAGIDSVYIKYY